MARTELQKYSITPMYSSLSCSKKLWSIWFMCIKINSSSSIFTMVTQDQESSNIKVSKLSLVIARKCCYHLMYIAIVFH